MEAEVVVGVVVRLESEVMVKVEVRRRRRSLRKPKRKRVEERERERDKTASARVRESSRIVLAHVGELALSWLHSFVRTCHSSRDGKVRCSTTSFPHMYF